MDDMTWSPKATFLSVGSQGSMEYTNVPLIAHLICRDRKGNDTPLSTINKYLRLERWVKLLPSSNENFLPHTPSSHLYIASLEESQVLAFGPLLLIPKGSNGTKDPGGPNSWI